MGLRWLYEIVSYKAVEAGIRVPQMDPRSPSQQCSRTDCGSTLEVIWNCEAYHCLKCGYEVHADSNGAKNVAVKDAKNLRRSPRRPTEGGSVDISSNSGLLTVDGPATVVAGEEGPRPR